MIEMDSGDLRTSVQPLSPEGPIFTYYDVNGNSIAAPVATPRNVKSIKVSFLVTVGDGHAEGEPTASSTQIYLRNF